MSTQIKKPIFPNAQAMAREDAEILATRVFIFSYSYGLIRLKKPVIFSEKQIIGLMSIPMVIIFALNNFFANNFWPFVAIAFYLVGSVFIFLNILKSKDPVGAMSLSIKNNWIIVLSVGVFGSLTFAGALYSINVIKHDVKKMISVAENVFQGIAYVDEKNFGFPPASEMAQYVPDSSLLKDYEQCAKNPKVLMRLLKNQLSKEITVRDYSKTITAWPFPLGYIIYNGDYPSGPYTYGFVFGKTFEDKNYQLKDLIVFIPVEESKRKERVIQHLTLIDSLCRDQ